MRNTRTVFTMVALLFTVIAPATFAAAQVRTTGEIRGRVFDPTSARIPGVSLQAKDLATAETRTTVSDELGAFVFLNLQAGAYELTALLPGFQTAVYSRVIVETARTTDLEVRLTVGAVTESVEVTAATPLLERTSSAISTTVRNDYIQDLPITGRSTLPFATLMAGAQTPGTSTRDSTFNGLPNASMNISIDGMNNNSQRWKSGGTSFFGFAPTRIDAIEEITVSTAGSGADAAAGGAMQIRFATRRGTNQYHGKVFYQIQNEALNATSFFNNARGLARTRTRANDFGGNVGGWLPVPGSSKRVYYFLNVEGTPQPVTITSTQNILTPDAQRGIFRYIGTDNAEHSVNLFQISAANGYPSQVDPTTARILNIINTSVPKGTLLPSTTDLNRVLLQWRQPDYTGSFYPTARVDYAISPKLAWHGSWNLRHQQFDGEPNYPDLATKANRLLWATESKVTTYVASNVVDWTISPSILNNFTFGVQSNLENFNQHASVFMWRDQGIPRLTFPPNTIVSPIPGGLPFPRNNPVYNWSDNLSWVRGKHTFNFGASLLYTRMYETTYSSAGVPTMNIGISGSDPVTSVLTAANIPLIRSSDVTGAWNLYAALTGRLNTVTGSRNVDENTKQYQDFSPRMPRQAFTSGGIYFQDSHQATSRLTLNYGFRWEISGTHHNTNGIYTDPGLDNLMGPSKQLFRPGMLDGVLDPQIFQKSYSYKSDKINPAPNFGFAWNPPRLGRRTVVRGSYGINYYDEGMNTIQFSVGTNAGGTQSISLQPGSQFAPGTLSISSALPAYAVNPPAFRFPMAQSYFTFTNGLYSTKPELHTPYVQNWSLGFQREITPNTMIEARYVGNKSTHIWRTYDLSETNIFENGFLQEFLNAQKNLAINTANGVANNFQNRGLPGQVALPIFEAAFGARGSRPALPPASGFTNGNFITQLQRGTVGAMANTLAQTNANIYLCRMTGNSFKPCADLGFSAPGPYPLNFFRANPFINFMTVVDDNSWSTYHGLQLELRRSFSNGLTLNANYTWSKALSDVNEPPDSQNIENYTTLRNRNLSKSPTPFDLRHAVTAYWSYELPFGKNRRFFRGANGALDRIIGGWTVSGISRWNSGRIFHLTSGGARATFNQFEPGVVLRGISHEELQEKVRRFRPGPNRNAAFGDPSFIGADGRANPAYFQFPSAGQLGNFIYLYGAPLVVNDLSLLKVIPINERLKFNLQVEAENAFNHPVLSIAGTGGTLSIDSVTFGQTSSTLVGPRQIQIRANILW